MSIEEMWDALKDDYGVSEQTLQVVTNINGYSTDTMPPNVTSMARWHDGTLLLRFPLGLWYRRDMG